MFRTVIIATVFTIIIALVGNNMSNLENTLNSLWSIGIFVILVGVIYFPIWILFIKRVVKNIQDFIETILILGIAVIWNQSVYYGARLIAERWDHYNMTTSIDHLVPFLPWTVSVYFGCYIFWGVNYYLCTIQDKMERNRFFCADALAKGLCLLLFLIIPTTNVRPEILGSNIWDQLMKLLYQIDSADNLFPSIHCLISWFCWIGVRKRKDISIGYRYFSLFAALAVCISTLTTRQHVIADVIGGILLAETCYLLAGFSQISELYMSSISYILRIFKLKKRP